MEVGSEPVFANDGSGDEPGELDDEPGIDDIEAMEDFMPYEPETAPDANDPDREPPRRQRVRRARSAAGSDEAGAHAPAESAPSAPLSNAESLGSERRRDWASRTSLVRQRSMNSTKLICLGARGALPASVAGQSHVLITPLRMTRRNTRLPHVLIDFFFTGQE